MTGDWTAYQDVLGEDRRPFFGLRAVGFIDQNGKTGVDWVFDYDEGSVPVYQALGLLEAVKWGIMHQGLADE